MLMIPTRSPQRLQAPNLRLDIVSLNIQMHSLFMNLCVTGLLQKNPDIGVRQTELPVYLTTLRWQRLLNGIKRLRPKRNTLIKIRHIDDKLTQTATMHDPILPLASVVSKSGHWSLPASGSGNNTKMTLIGTLVSNSVLVQVSDRRISLLHRDGSTELRDDITNKAVLYENRATLAFTGLAKLEGENTDIWIARRLAATTNLNDALEKITDDLTALFQRAFYRSHCHSIVIAGWKRNGPDEPTGFSGLVSNHFRLGGKWLTSPEPKFSWFVQMARPELPTLVFVPNLVPKKVGTSLYRQLLRVKHRGLNVANAVTLLADTIGSIADYRPTVGHELMVSVLPRSAVPPGASTEMTTISGSINPDTPTFYMLSASGDQVGYGPTIVTNGMIMTNLQWRPIT